MRNCLPCFIGAETKAMKLWRGLLGFAQKGYRIFEAFMEMYIMKKLSTDSRYFLHQNKHVFWFHLSTNFLILPSRQQSQDWGLPHVPGQAARCTTAGGIVHPCRWTTCTTLCTKTWLHADQSPVLMDTQPKGARAQNSTYRWRHSPQSCSQQQENRGNKRRRKKPVILKPVHIFLKKH